MGRTIIKMLNGQLFNMSKHDLCSSSSTSRVIEIILTIFRNELSSDDDIVDLKEYSRKRNDLEEEFNEEDNDEAMYKFLIMNNKLVPVGISFSIYKDFRSNYSWLVLLFKD